MLTDPLVLWVKHPGLEVERVSDTELCLIARATHFPDFKRRKIYWLLLQEEGHADVLVHIKDLTPRFIKARNKPGLEIKLGARFPIVEANLDKIFGTGKLIQHPRMLCPVSAFGYYQVADGTLMAKPADEETGEAANG